MTRTYLVRGMLAGLLAGLAALAFAKLVAEPQIARAERFEAQVDAAQHRPLDKPLVSRDVQDTIGLGTGVAVAGIALGGLFGLGFAVVYRRFGDTPARATAAEVALAGFVALFAVPFLKYPANPPSVGNPDTIGRRTALYFTCVAIGLLAVVVAAAIRALAAPRLGSWNATLAGAAALLALITVAYVALPGIDEVPSGFPATLLWRFRLASAGTEAVLWGTLGIAFGALTERSEARARAAAAGG